MIRHHVLATHNPQELAKDEAQENSGWPGMRMEYRNPVAPIAEMTAADASSY